ncbi:hypothetical protein B0T19DRAFT_398351 [Cercophora scortea]|uniref:Cytochrome c oxidase assembly protein n=1 Tax=Cercophora scortea TaxID=314031 RepID=A0AAE0MHE4_9PEZI|nr:hypothetical protein B0T19DRAFT_398351 [Cercophora scortea]
MSRASKLTLFGTSLFAAVTVIFVHNQQKWEKKAMHQGVIRDMEQQRVKRERQLDFDMQRELEAEYKKEQSVRETTAEANFTPSGRAAPVAAAAETAVASSGAGR